MKQKRYFFCSFLTNLFGTFRSTCTATGYRCLVIYKESSHTPFINIIKNWFTFETKCMLFRTIFLLRTFLKEWKIYCYGLTSADSKYLEKRGYELSHKSYLICDRYFWKIHKITRLKTIIFFLHFMAFYWAPLGISLHYISCQGS